MPFVALRFDVDGTDADAWADALLAADALSVDITDPRAGTPEEAPLYDEPGVAPGGSWPVSRLTALFAAGTDPGGALARAGQALQRLPPAHETHAVADEDWVRATQTQFAPLRITDRLWVVPSWCTPPDPGALNLTLDPGLAFGTGAHPTTRLCLAWLADTLRGGERVLDYGCGSGILAIAAARLGAGAVIGVDIDPQAVEASRGNALRNGIAATFALASALTSPPAAEFDVVVANILANPLVRLAPEIAARTCAGGRIVLAGLLAAQVDAVGAAYARWFRIAACASEDGWVALAGERRAGAPDPR